MQLFCKVSFYFQTSLVPSSLVLFVCFVYVVVCRTGWFNESLRFMNSCFVRKGNFDPVRLLKFVS